jgi:hypothetical protein
MADITTFETGDSLQEYDRSSSRNRGMRVVTYNGVPLMEFPTESRISSDQSDTVYIVQAGEEGRLDLIAAKLYQDPALWWLLAQANEIFDPFSPTEMYAGMPLRVPQLQRIT